MSASVSPAKSATGPASPAKSAGKPASTAAATKAAKPASKASGAKKAATTKKAAATRKPTTTKPKAVAAKSKASAVSNSKPSWKEIIKECIVLHKEEARQGVSRSTIKKYAEEKYKLEMNASHLSQLNRAITHGAETGMFMLPKGPSGKVKLPPKNSKAADDLKENAKPPSKTTGVKAAPAKKVPAKKAPATAAKKPAPKATTAKTATAKKAAAKPAAKKVLAGKPKASSTTKKTTAPTKRASAKKAVTGTTAASKAKVCILNRLISVQAFTNEIFQGCR
ncbi:histone H1 [Lentinula raphanica]|nr:histone H1 [Lentinula raphanica]